MAAPIARTETVSETRFGVTLADPYRWMEDAAGGEFRAWLEGQAAHADSVLGGLAERDALLERIGELSGAAAARGRFRLAGERVFYLRHDPDAAVPVLTVRRAAGGAERVLLDPNTTAGAAAGAAHSSMDWYAPSPDGRYVACGIAQGGAELSTLHLVDVDDGTVLAERITRVRQPFVSWAKDGRSFAYHRYRDLPPGTPPDRRRDDSGSFLHRLGDDPDTDRPLLARGLNPRVPMTPRDRPFISFARAGSWVLALISHGALGPGITEWLSDCTLYVAPAGGLAEPASCPWTRVAGVEDGVTALAFDRDALYLVARCGAPRGQVLAVDLAGLGKAAPGLAGARVAVAQGPRVIEAVEVVRGHLLVRDLDRGVGRLRQVPVGGGEPREVPLPVEGTVEEWAPSADGSALLLRLASWTDPPRLYRYDPGSGALEDTGWIPPWPVDLGEVQVREVQVPARDGTPVPLSILHRKGLPLDGSNPTVLTGYGSYGFSLRPQFRPELLAWYERGGVYAVAHLRGGGELGGEWHEAGRLLNKETTVTDFIDCAEYLIGQGYTSPARLAGEGGSAGGIPTGGALVRRPELWAAMVMHVPVTNATRFEFSENGPINVPELGSVTTEEGLRALLIADSYLRVRDGDPYPAVLLTAGVNDSRVAAWQPAKMAARLQAATSSARPVLLRVERDGGHGFGATRQQHDRLLADVLAFLLDQVAAGPA